MIITANQPIDSKDNSLVIYYSGANFTHGYGEYDKPYEDWNKFCVGRI
ncbi:MAG: hypothetical protein RML38_07220 [Bacteroidia bacterium]|nr:hypothetical protein [Bacteroidia bacterium]